MSIERPEEPQDKEIIKNGYKYTYRDNAKGGEVIFECIAKDILDADKLYEKEIGVDPKKQMHIGCSSDGYLKGGSYPTQHVPESLEDEALAAEEPQYEVRNEGDILVVDGDIQELAAMGVRIAEILNKSELGEKAKTTLLSGETLRPGGAYAVYILMGKLYVDTRNARGDDVARREIQRAVENVLR